MSAPVVSAVAAQQHERAIAWVRAFLHALRSGDAALRRLAQRELRALGVAVAPVPASLHQPSAHASREISAPSAAEIPEANEVDVSRGESPHASVAGGKAAGDDGERR